MPMTYSKSGLQLTESFEGVRLTAYKDQGGVLTIGYGHTGKDVTLGQVISQSQAESLLRRDIQSSSDWVNKLVTVPMTQGQFDALVDLDFNIGCGNFEHSTVLKQFNLKNAPSAAKAFEMWNTIHSVINAGLTRRRLAEEAEFNQG